MVAIINSGKSIRKTFFYNDKKLEKGTAVLLRAENYPMDMERMNQNQRLNMLLMTAKKHPMERPSLHISLNFAPGENISDESIKQIAAEYMEGIGLSNQPYLLYRHFDAAHPHVHIVTHRINPDGTTFDTYKIGEKKSEPVRKALEIKYNLVRADDHKRGLFRMAPINVDKVIYSKSETKKSIEDRVNYAISKYKFTSLAALNAVLKGYNIYADRGSKKSRIYKNNGLVYRLIGPGGNLVGGPIPASDLNDQPTLKALQKCFKHKNAFSDKEKTRVKNAIDLALKKTPPPTITALSAALFKQHIRLVTHVNSDRQLYGITYVDMTNRCAFNGSDLAKAYSANAIQERCSAENTQSLKESEHTERLKKEGQNIDSRRPGSVKTTSPGIPEAPRFEPTSDHSGPDEKSLFEILMQPEEIYEQLPYALRRKKKRRTKK